MRYLFKILGLSAVLCASGTLAAGTEAPGDELILPVQKMSVDLETGIVSRNGERGLCLETVSQAGPHKLLVRRNPGDDVATVTVNGIPQDWVAAASGRARMGALRLSRDGSLAVLRTWKTGEKQTELLQDGQTAMSWRRDTSVKLLRYATDAVLLLEKRAAGPWHLNRYRRNEDGRIETVAQTLVEFGTCEPGRLRIAGNTLWAQLDCTRNDKGIYKVDLKTGAVGKPLLASRQAEFTKLPTSFGLSDGQTIMDVSGTPAAVRFFYAVSGLLLSQTGEVRACSSDAEGLQSWNQSYRLRALTVLYEKTGADVFARLALKSMRLTLAASDALQKHADPEGPQCGWSSTIYGTNPGERLSLMINQAMIANALTQSCKVLGGLCPQKLRDEIAGTNACLVRKFEREFDTAHGLYRINGDTDFRFAGKLAPWNWQIAFAGILDASALPEMQQRAANMVRTFLDEWESDENGGLWRYWPKGYYLEKGLSQKQLAEQRNEDTGHAGITLLTLSDFASGATDRILRAVRDRLDFVLAFGTETPRDLDGEGPRGARWFPASGWSHYASPMFKDVYSAAVPGHVSADTLYAYAQLFDASDPFQLTIDIYSCADVCTKQRELSYASLQAFMSGNPFFQVLAETRGN
ncbi:hypothetical protein [Roseibium sp. MMSF_3412]|uniref:hypothetical protein n=1 Tax=Roseibium sp. MMSF_3412 TaxID=3046712 RepID=UPI00273D772D|nr:hypothetical protein [Roseibium sp. MMSF_3412]